jgi:hypothetical protein
MSVSDFLASLWRFYHVPAPPVSITTGCALGQILLHSSQGQYSRRLAFHYDIYMDFIYTYTSIIRYNWMTPCSGVVFEKLTGCHLVKEIPRQSLSSLPCTEQSGTGPYPEPEGSQKPEIFSNTAVTTSNRALWNQWSSHYFQKVSSGADSQTR